MNLREFLKIELWSKRTSWRILVCLGIVVGIAVLGSQCWKIAERHWLTPGERIAAKAALEEIDRLQDFNSINDHDFAAAMKHSQARMDEAERAAWTARDRLVVSKLMSYQLLTMVERLHLRDRRLLEKQDLSTAKFDQIWDSMQSARSGSRASVKLELHQALD